MERLLLIDGDILCHQCALKSEEPIDWGDDIWSVHADLSKAKKLVEKQLSRWMDLLSGSRFVIAFSDKRYFRQDIYPLYKASRKGSPKPILYKVLKDWMFDTYRCYQKPDLEADDVLGILSTHETVLTGNKIIVSIDKDMEQIPGYLFNPDKDQDIREISLCMGDYHFYKQILTGDRVDNYPGCPGIGSVRATRFLDAVIDPANHNPKALWDVVLEQFNQKGLGKEEALSQARVARILRSSDYDFNKKQAILWQPV